MTRSPDVIVVGGGPAGLAAAEALAEAGKAVTLYDRMPSVGRKLLLAGRGGLNLTHSEPLERFLDRYHPAGALAESIAAFPPAALREWCDGLGQPTFVGSSGRVFPDSFKASPLLRAWLARLDRLGVAIRPRHRLVGWGAEGGMDLDGPEGRIALPPRPTILALGGASWPRLGSDGAWAPLLQEAGVAVTALRPANGGFTAAWSEVFGGRFSGAPLKRIGLSLDEASVRGEALVTTNGLEGGAIYALSRPIREAIDARGEAMVAIDLRPDLTVEALGRRLGESKPSQSLATRLRKAAGLSPVAAGLLREAAGKAMPVQAEALAALIKAAPIRLLSAQPIERAISTAGGVALACLDARLMVSARPGLFVAGEMLDWEAPTGGYLLQGAIASGRMAAAGLIAWSDETRA